MNERPLTQELRLLLACSSVLSSQESHFRILQILGDGVNWSLFARMSVEHGLAGLAGQALNDAASDMLPDEIRDAFLVRADQAYQRNCALFGELARVVEALTNNGITAIALGAPDLALRAYRLRVVRELHILIRDSDIAPTVSTLRGLGYERPALLNAAKPALIQRLQGHDTLFKRALTVGITVRTRLAPELLDIDHERLWHRARPTAVNSRVITTLAPDDEFLTLAVDGGQELWRSMGSACNVAHFIGSHPDLDWTVILDRARAQGCFRMVLLAAALAGRYFDATLPDAVIAVERRDAAIQSFVQRVTARWLAEESGGPTGDSGFSMDRLRLYDGVARRARHVARTLLLPGAYHVAQVPLPSRLTSVWAYVPIKIVFDAGLRPLARACRALRAQAGRLRAGKLEAAILDIDHDPAPGLQDAEAWARRAGFLLASQRFGEAATACDRALAIDPNHFAAMRMGIRSRISACDWHRRQDDERRITEGVKANLLIINPFNHRTISDSEAESLAVARLVARGMAQPDALWRGEKYHHDRIHVAYLSAEFHEHPMTSVLAGVYEHHDKSRFETIAISLGPPSGSPMRRRIEAAFERFIDARIMSDAEVAAMLRDMEVDIAIDLNGYAGSGRMGILAHRPAPIQVNFVAYSGTSGVPFLDYIIGDHRVIPEQNRIHYSEQVVYLPHSFMPNDRARPIADPPTRTEAGLPKTGVVFACHNALHKISPNTFDVWMRLLHAIEGSVLWLKSPEPSATVNLQREARARGVAPGRLIFAPSLPQIEDHLARLRLADLFLDTLPYNAHATACDALWSGLPVLTCRGNTFAGRVAASLLQAVELPELITSSLAEYEELALALARDPERLAAIRVKLMRNRLTSPLFDTARYTHDLESAYSTMWERAQRGEPPASFSVAAMSRCATAARSSITVPDPCRPA